MNKKILWYIFGGVVILVALGFIIFSKPVSTVSPEPAPSNAEQQQQTTNMGNETLTQPAMQIDKSKTYVATLTTTDGDIVIALDANATPITVNNFVYLAGKHFYDGTIFHRVIKGFMIQGGDPTGTGTGGPGYSFNDEPFQGSYSRGTVAMANAGPNTNGSQFFIMQENVPLQPDYVIFGRVTEGMDVVDKIANAPVQPSSNGEVSKPVQPVTVESITVKEQ